MNSVNVHTHHRMGDHLICYGGIKELAKRYDQLVVRTFAQYFKNIQRLYSTIPNVKVLILEDNQWDQSGILFCSTNWWFEQVKQWYDIKNRPDISTYSQGEDMIFDRFWYNIAGLPFNLKWDNFYLKRNIEIEENVCKNILGVHNIDKPYIFLHEDATCIEEDRTIKRKYINSDIRIINISEFNDISILDMALLIERAQEVHVINSAFLTFIDLMNIQHPNLYYHKYARPNPVEQVALRLNWNIIDK